MKYIEMIFGASWRTSLAGYVLVILFILSPFSCFLSPSPAYAGSTTITFAWDAVHDAAKYQVFQSRTTNFPASKEGLTKVCDTSALTCTVTNVPDGLYYYAAIALDDANNESDFSDWVSYNGDTTGPAKLGRFVIITTTKTTTVVNP